MLGGRIQRRALPRYQSEEMKILTTSNPQPVRLQSHAYALAPRPASTNNKCLYLSGK